jgi:hypothetical protein
VAASDGNRRMAQALRPVVFYTRRRQPRVSPPFPRPVDRRCRLFCMAEGAPLPCPFCGHAPIVTNKEPLYGDGWIVKCSNLYAGNCPPGIGCEIVPATLPQTSAAAVKSWNIRTRPTTPHKATPS